MALISLHYISPFKYAYEALAIDQFDSNSSWVTFHSNHLCFQVLFFSPCYSSALLTVSLFCPIPSLLSRLISSQLSQLFPLILSILSLVPPLLSLIPPPLSLIPPLLSLIPPLLSLILSLLFHPSPLPLIPFLLSLPISPLIPSLPSHPIIPPLSSHVITPRPSPCYLNVTNSFQNLLENTPTKPTLLSHSLGIPPSPPGGSPYPTPSQLHSQLLSTTLFTNPLHELALSRLSPEMRATVERGGGGAGGCLLTGPQLLVNRALDQLGKWECLAVLLAIGLAVKFITLLLLVRLRRAKQK
ncbi:unnamed protein product [Closterium sp. NIES-64]|nr:unnamed protein product [Closterium sp. NIES-64]